MSTPPGRNPARHNIGQTPLVASLALLFVVVFALNVPPAFAPPTWMAISVFGFRYPGTPTVLVALVAAAAATCGRIVLAQFAGRIVGSRFVSRAMKESLASVAEVVRQRRSGSVAIFLLFSVSPFPANVLFLGYGLTRAPLRLLAIPFFIGRCASYAVVFAGGALASRRFQSHIAGWNSWFWAYFVLVEVGLLALVYAFAKVDWRKTCEERRLRWIS
jgi:membrane protein YqaA with SNARE-associated domain